MSRAYDRSERALRQFSRLIEAMNIAKASDIELLDLDVLYAFFKREIESAYEAGMIDATRKETKEPE